MCVYAGEVCVRAPVDSCNQLSGLGGVKAAATHASLDVDVQIQDVLAAG